VNKKIFKYNMILYYQLLVFYFVSFVIYVLLKLQFSGFDWNKIIHDSIFYLFIILFGYVLISTLYYLIKDKMIIITDDRIILSSKFKTIEIPIEKIESIRIKREHRFHLSGLLRTIKIKLKNEKKTLVVRPFDFENDEDLLQEFLRIKEAVQKSIEVKNA